MDFYFVRHGQASHKAPSDEQRPLTTTGVAHVERLAQVLQQMQVQPDVIYSSPRLRARQTADILAGALGNRVIISEACNFKFNLTYAFDLVRDLKSDASVMFIGHNPSMSMTVNQVSGAHVDLDAGAIACVSHVVPDRDQHGATLRWLLTPLIVAALV
jgi:phosphohistidine phosphatase